MNKSWGHTVRPLSEEEIQRQIENGKHWYEWQNNHPKEGQVTYDEATYIHKERKCRISGKCGNESSFMLTYRYVTGRAGRTSFAEKQICEHHAQKYIKQ